MVIRKVLLWTIIFGLAHHANAEFFNDRTPVQQEVDSLYDLAWDYLKVNPDSSLIMGQFLLDFSKKANDAMGEVKGYYINPLGELKF